MVSNSHFKNFFPWPLILLSHSFLPSWRGKEVKESTFTSGRRLSLLWITFPRPFFRAFISQSKKVFRRRSVAGIVWRWRFWWRRRATWRCGTLGAREGRVEIEEAVRRRVVSAAPCRQGKFQSTVAPVWNNSLQSSSSWRAARESASSIY